jgi:DNA (cytosine-5)-methyltransferase 1
MWGEMARIIREVRPRYVFVENSPMLTSRGLGRVLGDLAAMGFDAKWGVLGAADVGANHQRDRIWIVATNTRHGEQEQQKSFVRPECRKSVGEKPSNLCKNIPNSASLRLQGQGQHEQPIGAEKGGHWQANIFKSIGTSDQWAIEPNMGRVADGVAARVDRLKAIGNGQVPLCAATAWRVLTRDWIV